ncbi:hypothetical protein TorRG33x02_031270 [Trema orientale]|uniref:Uncharacterized protein n=1 Tax=Trema orientale TaxID=63057 RepID=A0A2P5FT42_TREOI|nr:hypothetical protein TorRG33x02_031270 [Trema orientale]
MRKVIRGEVNTELLALKSEKLNTVRNKSYVRPSCNIELNSTWKAKAEMQDFIKAEVHRQIEKMKLELLATIENSLNFDHRTSTPSKEGAKVTVHLPKDVMQSIKKTNSKRPRTAKSGSGSSFKEQEHDQEDIPKVSMPLPEDVVMLAIKKTNGKRPCITKTVSSIFSKEEHDQDVIPKLNDSNASNQGRKPSKPKQKYIIIKDNCDNEVDTSDNNDKKNDDNAEKTNLRYIYAQYVNNGGLKVGPFELSFIAAKEEFKLTMYIYDDRLSLK